MSEGYLSLQALLKILQVNSNSYNRFMNGKYKDQWSATSNNTYDAGSYFLYREKKAGKQSFAALHSSKTAASGGGATAKVSLPDVSGVVLEDFQVFLTPIEVRKEIQRVLATYKCSQSDIAKAAGAPNGGAVSRFMAKGGEFGGKDMDFYEAGAEFLEKLRIKENKPKSKKRKAIEAETRPGKKPFLGHDPNQKVWCFADETPQHTRDALGRLVIL